MAARAALYRFEDFDPPRREASPPPPDPRALERARQDGFADGQAAGRQEAEDAYRASQAAVDQEAQAAHAAGLAAATAAFDVLGAAADEAREHAARAAARLAAACLQRLVANLSEGEAQARAAAFAREIAQAAADQPTLTVRAGVRAAQVAHDALAAGRAGALELVVDPGLAPYAVVADWETGGAQYDALADAAILEDLIARACATLAPPPPSPQSPNTEEPL